MQPRTQYVRGLEGHVAYRVLGQGPRDIVLVPDHPNNIEVMWEEPALARFLEETATEVSVKLRPPPLSKLCPRETNYVRLRLSPDVTIAIAARVKQLGAPRSRARSHRSSRAPRPSSRRRR